MYRHNPNLTIYPPDRSGSPVPRSSSYPPVTTPTSRRSGTSPTLSPTPTFPDPIDDDEVPRKPSPSRRPTIPLFKDSLNPARRSAFSLGTLIRSIRGRRTRILLAAAVILAGGWYFVAGSERGVQTGVLQPALEELGKLKEAVARRPPPIPVKKQPIPAIKGRKRPRPASIPPPPITKVVDVDVWPEDLDSDRPRKNERFLAYSPHSGYHNQRISLENALTLAFILDRTLLLPPVWVGHAIPYLHFDKMQHRLRSASKEGLDRCVDVGDGGSAEPLPRECEGFFDWTLVHWDFLVDLADAHTLVKTRDRWNHTEAWLEDELGLAKHDKYGTSTDTYHLKDSRLYEYRFYDTPEDDEPLNKFEKRLDLDQLARDSADYKLVHVGTLFGTSRFRVQKEVNFDARSLFRLAMVFQNSLNDEITNEIRDRLGGAGKYYGLHLRVGDGIFMKEAADNMAGVWHMLCVTKMKQSEEVCAEVSALSASRQSSTSRQSRQRRQLLLPATDDDEPVLLRPSYNSSADSLRLAKRANSRPQRAGAYHHAPLPKLRVIRTRADSSLDKTLSCRAPLHTATHLLPFNAPLFIATDAKVPTADRNLALFFDAFPCTFILGDFSSTNDVNSKAVARLGKLAGLRNKDDKTPLAQFLYPQLDAQIAAYGRGLVGTPQSTYSRFAIDVLHQHYHGWDIVERG